MESEQQRKRHGGYAGVVSSLMPIAIVGGLLYTALFVKAAPSIGSLKMPAIERRDHFYGVAAPTPTILWAVGSNGKIVRSEDGGANWQMQSGPVDAHLQSIAAWDVQRAVAVGNAGRLEITADGGHTWTEVAVPRSEVANKLLRVKAYPNGKGWAVGEMGLALESSDYGKSWQRILPEKDRAWNDVSFQGNDGWLVGEFGQIARTGDGGATWTPVDTPIHTSLMAVEFRDARNGVAVGLSGTLLTTADGGRTWQAMKSGTIEHLNDVVWTGSSWIAVGDKGIRVTADGDETRWTAARISDKDLSWHTQIEPLAGGRFLLAGANLELLDGEHLQVIGR